MSSGEDLHRLVNEVNSKYATGRGVVQHIGVRRIDKQARGRLSWYRRSGPRGELGSCAVNQVAGFAPDSREFL